MKDNYNSQKNENASDTEGQEEKQRTSPTGKQFVLSFPFYQKCIIYLIVCLSAPLKPATHSQAEPKDIYIVQNYKWGARTMNKIFLSLPLITGTEKDHNFFF